MTTTILAPDSSIVPFEEFVHVLAQNDVFYLGEIHISKEVHQAHLEAIKRLETQRPLVMGSFEEFFDVRLAWDNGTALALSEALGRTPRLWLSS